MEEMAEMAEMVTLEYQLDGEKSIDPFVVSLRNLKRNLKKLLKKKLN